MVTFALIYILFNIFISANKNADKQKTIRNT